MQPSAPQERPGARERARTEVYQLLLDRLRV